MDNLFWMAFALFLILEGLGPLLFPKKWRNYILQLANQPAQSLRLMGGIMVAIGFILWHWLN
ncbi:DUF2065 domain-containing protein [Neptunicella sp. SCSIO 80796]|uniref:DUF2065 domain-containing protein n=1 Tax=Neptunicella plasticusilytica TaxID=3117012 RepID=UPI003A4E4972